MQELVREYLGELRSKRRKRRRISVAVILLVVMVAGGVIGALVQYGVAMTGDARCGIEEHTHSGECYADALACGQEEREGHVHTDACYQTESTLTCGLEESEATEESEGHTHSAECYTQTQTLVCGQEESAGHTHTDACYEKQLVCQKEEHTHTDDCYIDRTADVEEASVWDRQYADVEWKDAWGEDLATAARMQIGYKESTKNYNVAEDGSHKGYTRFGQFAGDAYADWDASFVNFCLHYAGLEASGMFPKEIKTAEWYDTFVKANEENQNYLTAPAGYEPKTGDIIFFHKENEETDTQMGIVSSYDKEKEEIKVIEGNSANEVRENPYKTDDEHISSYLTVSEMEKAYKQSDAEEGNTEENTEGNAEENTEIQEDTRQIFTTEENDKEGWAYEESYEDDTIVIHVKAGEGVVPEGAELSVTPIEQKEVTSDMTEEEAAEAEKINEQYEFTNQKLQEESEKKKETLEGFLAYDICFIVDGEEVEPSGDVKVTMDFKEAAKPEGVSGNAVVAVNHLKEDENAADGVVVEDLTEKESTTIATAEADASVEKVELVAESFSTFTITWRATQFNEIATVSINLDIMDENKNPIESNLESFIVNENEDINLYSLFENGIKSTEGEFYEVKEIKFIEGDKNCNVVKLKVSGFTFTFYDSENIEYTYALMGYNNSITIQLICQKSNINKIEINDIVEENGCIEVIGGDRIIAKYPNSKTEYVWLKKVNNGEFEKVESVTYDNISTISADGTTLNVAMDNGGLTRTRSSVEYKVVLRITNENGEIQNIESEVFSVPYWSEIRNGSFERPVQNDNIQFYHYISMEEMDGWRTTDITSETAGCIEVARVVNGYICELYGEGRNGTMKADDGDQFAEINALGNAALYQDVLTYQGRPLNYYFSHRGRKNSWTSGKDTMYVVIMPTNLAKEGVEGVVDGPIDTNSKVDLLMDMPEEWRKAHGVYKEKYVSEPGIWTKNEGVYEPLTGMTRFFFVSAQKEMPSYGNFIDNVSFTQDLPEPSKGTFNLRVEKTVEGLKLNGTTREEKIADLKKQLENLNFDITVKDKEEEYVNVTGSNLLTGGVTNLKAENMIWYPDKNGSFTGYYDYVKVPIQDGSEYTISVTEKDPKVTGYTDKTTKKASVITPGEDDKEDTVTETPDSSIANVQSEQSVTITHINTYVSDDIDPNATKDISVTKIWKDLNNKYNTRPTGLEVKLVGKILDLDKDDGTLRNLTEEEYKTLFEDRLKKESLEKILSKTLIGDKWQDKWEDIPVYFGDTATEITWSVEESFNDSRYELEESGKVEKNASVLGEIENTPEVERNEEYSITNALKEESFKGWEMYKCSSSTGSDGEKKMLQGAEFAIKQGSPLSEITVATGVSDSDGKITWTLRLKDSDKKNWDEFKKTLNGKYKVVETKAPEGYVPDTTGWEVEFVNGIISVEETENVKIEGDLSKDDIKIYIGNTALYALPDAGGSGIYGYMFSGILLMAVAVLITYRNKNRYKEVLRS